MDLRTKSKITEVFNGTEDHGIHVIWITVDGGGVQGFGGVCFDDGESDLEKDFISASCGRKPRPSGRGGARSGLCQTGVLGCEHARSDGPRRQPPTTTRDCYLPVLGSLAARLLGEQRMPCR
jgi:hypothetical protein